MKPNELEKILIRVRAEIRRPEGAPIDSTVTADFYGMVSAGSLGRALLFAASKLANVDDDAGCDWYTYGTSVYIGGPDWFVINDEQIAQLVNTANILIYGKVLTLVPGVGQKEYLVKEYKEYK